MVMMTSSNGNIFRVTGHLCGEFTDPRWIPHTKASDAELWCFLKTLVWINDWVNNGEAGDLRRYRAHYVVTVMWCSKNKWLGEWQDGRPCCKYIKKYYSSKWRILISRMIKTIVVEVTNRDHVASHLYLTRDDESMKNDILMIYLMKNISENDNEIPCNQDSFNKPASLC